MILSIGDFITILESLIMEFFRIPVMTPKESEKDDGFLENIQVKCTETLSWFVPILRFRIFYRIVLEVVFRSVFVFKPRFFNLLSNSRVLCSS